MSEKPRSVGVGLIGYGNIGREVFNYYKRGGHAARIVAVGRKRVRAPAPAGVKRLIAKPAAVIANPRTEIVVEMTGDAEQGAAYLLDAIRAGKHVVTANKEALAKHWRPIMDNARRRGVTVGFEATVGGGMPVVRTMQRHIASDEIEAFAGILNGTCNFILARMREYIMRHMDDPQIQKRSLPLEDALAEAQRLGFAEPDPTADISGADTKYKLAILTNLAFETYVDPDRIHCEGIWDTRQRIMPSDLYFLNHKRYLDGKYALKLVGVAERRNGRPTLRVHPALIETSGALADLAKVDESYNGIVVRGERLGTQFLKGLGAGPRPTSISIASDVREIATALQAGRESPGAFAPVPQVRNRGAPGSVRDVPTRGFIRSFSPDVKGIYAKKLDVLATHKVNVQSVVNVKEFVYGAGRVMPDYIEIDESPDGAVQDALRAFGRLRDVRDPMYFRVLEL